MSAPANTRFDRSWRQALPALLLALAFVLVVYRDTAAAMVTVWWTSDTFAHSILVLPITLWLIWRKREALAEHPPQPARWMLLTIALIGFAWLLGDLAAANSVTQIAMVALLVSAVIAVLGVRVTRVIAFPLAFLFFAVPIGEFMLPQLMSWTADFTVLGLRASGIPVFREGNQIVIPSGNWSVVEACSGIRYLMASFMVGSLFGYLHYRSARRRWIFAAIAIGVPIVANWVRAYLIVMLGHLSNNNLAVGVDHLIYGWLFFGLVMGVMFAIGTWWREPLLSTDAALGAGKDPHPAGRSGSAGAFWTTAVTATFLGLAPHLAEMILSDSGPRATPRLAQGSALSESWQLSGGGAASWKPAFRNPSAETNFTYSSAGRDVGMYIGYYRQQNYQRKLVSSDNALVRSDDSAWIRLEAERSRTLGTNAGTLTVSSTLLRGRLHRVQEQRLRVWQFYWVDDRLTSSDFRAKMYGALGRLLGRGDDAAVIVLYTSEDQPNAEALLESFVRANLNEIVARLRSARDGSVANVAATSQRIS
jgi:exosortase A